MAVPMRLRRPGPQFGTNQAVFFGHLIPSILPSAKYIYIFCQKFYRTKLVHLARGQKNLISSVNLFNV